MIREECGYYKIRRMEEKKRERKARDKKKSGKFQEVEKGRKPLWIFSFFFSSFCNFYRYLGGEEGRL